MINHTTRSYSNLDQKTERLEKIKELGKKTLQNKTLLLWLYLDQRMTLQQIANLLRVTRKTIRRELVHHGIKVRKRTTKPRISKKDLQEYYVDKQMTLKEIATYYNLKSESSVRYYLDKYKIARRPKFSTTLSKLSKKELYELYWTLKMSSNEIGESLGVNGRTVRKRLNYLGIKLRSREDGIRLSKRKNIPFTPHLYEFIIGSILGDGYISVKSPTSPTARYRISLCAASKEYIEYIASLFREAGYTVNIYKTLVGSPDDRDKLFPGYQLQTESSCELKELHDTFYRLPTPDEKKEDPRRRFIKIVPKTITLNSTRCLHWYLEDGSFCRTTKSIKISTQGFTREENQRLIIELKKIMKVDNGLTLIKRNAIRFHKKTSITFLEFIGKFSPFKCFEYKFQ
ncbi:MAG: LAGLIDADG family homing endonuclease [Promethearchaeota archaeon]